MKRYAFLLLLIPALALSGAIKVWAPGDTLNINDLNSALSHIHSTMVGGHGARLKNADVSPVAAISHSKLATPGLVPKNITQVGVTPATACAASPCTFSTLSGFALTSITWAGPATYTVTFPARANANYIVHLNASTGGTYCTAGTFTTTTFAVVCYNAAGAATASAFQFTILDNDN